VTDVLKSESVYYNIEVTCIHCNDKIIINSTYFNNKGIRKCPCTTIKEREESHRKKKEAQIANSIRKKEEHKKKLQEAREKGVLLRFKDLTGQRFGMLYVIKHEGFTSSPNGKIHPTFLCKCLCGNRKVIKGSNLTQLGKYNCGCITAKQNKLKAINTNKKLKEKRDRLIELGLATPKIPRDRHSKRSMKLSTTIRYKYNNTCQKCHQYFPKGECDAHHAIPFAKSEKYRFMTSNCVLLCKKCHRQFHAKYGYFEFVPKDTIEYLFGR
jgi:5-methylcytosine-specific restriction endonuclease McrA